MASLEDLAAKFSVESLPAGASDYDRLEFLFYWAKNAEQVIAALPEPTVVGDTVFGDMEDVKKAVEVVAEAANPVQVAASSMRNFLLLSFVAATWGIKAHHPNARQMLVKTGQVTAAELDADYRRRLGVLQAITKLGTSGFLDPLFALKGKALGLAPLVIGGLSIPGYIVIGTIALVVFAIALVAISLTALFLFNRFVQKWCFDDQGNPREQTMEKCPELFDEAAGLARGPSDLLSKVVTYAAVGLGVYALIVLGPDIIQGIKGFSKAARA